MLTKNLFVLCLAVLTFTVVSGAPRAFKNEDDFKQSVVEFLSQDTQFLSALEHSGLVAEAPGLLTRQKRQSEAVGMDLDQNDDADDAPPKDGFFDRAAKFVVELMQRFLKWLNSDN